MHVCLSVKFTCHHLKLNKLRHEIVVIRTTKESQGSVLKAATDWKSTSTVAFADPLFTMALVKESGAGVLDPVILTAGPDWTNSLVFADHMSTVAAVTGFGGCIVDTVILPATSWTDSVAFWTRDSRTKTRISYD